MYDRSLLASLFITASWLVLGPSPVHAGSAGTFAILMPDIQGATAIMYLLCGAMIIAGIAYAGYELIFMRQYGGIGKGILGFLATAMFAVFVYQYGPTVTTQAAAFGATLR